MPRKIKENQGQKQFNLLWLNQQLKQHWLTLLWRHTPAKDAMDTYAPVPLTVKKRDISQHVLSNLNKCPAMEEVVHHSAIHHPCEQLIPCLVLAEAAAWLWDRLPPQHTHKHTHIYACCQLFLHCPPKHTLNPSDYLHTVIYHCPHLPLL